MQDITPNSRGRIRSQPRAGVAARRVVYQPVTLAGPVINSVTYRPVVVEEPVEADPIADMGDLDSQFTTYTYSKQLGKTARRSEILTRGMQREVASHKRNLWQRFRAPALTGLAVVVLASTGYVGVDTWLTNNKANLQLQQVSAAPLSDAQHQAAEGADTTPLPKGAIKNYHVAADLPQDLYIAKLGVAARILPMGVNPDDSMQAPVNIYDAGWYTSSSKPGQGGAVVIDGHSTADKGALFGELGKLKKGDTVQLKKGDGTMLTYKVAFTQTVPKDKVDMTKLLAPYGGAKQGLNLITCEGQWVNSAKTLANRTIVYTVPA